MGDLMRDDAGPALVRIERRQIDQEQPVLLRGRLRRAHESSRLQLRDAGGLERQVDHERARGVGAANTNKPDVAQDESLDRGRQASEQLGQDRADVESRILAGRGRHIRGRHDCTPSGRPAAASRPAGRAGTGSSSGSRYTVPLNG